MDTRTTYTITANTTGHYFADGALVRYTGQDNAVPAVPARNGRPGRDALPAHRWLFSGRNHQTGARIVQWLAAEEVAPRS